MENKAFEYYALIKKENGKYTIAVETLEDGSRKAAMFKTAGECRNWISQQDNPKLYLFHAQD